MKLYAINFELEDFGQNISHVVRKTYYSYNFFTDRQVYAGLTRDFDFIGRQSYEFKRVPCTIAIPINVKKIKNWYSIKNANLQKETNTGKLRYLTEGFQELILPGSEFLAFSFIKPKDKTLFLGKKSTLAFLDSVEEVEFKIKKNAWTSLELLYFTDYEKYVNKEIFKLKTIDASQRFLVGKIKTSDSIEVEYRGNIYRFYGLWKFLDEYNENNLS